jgi:hypothetical protein
VGLATGARLAFSGLVAPGRSGCAETDGVIQRNFSYAISTMQGKGGHAIEEQEK